MSKIKGFCVHGNISFINFYRFTKVYNVQVWILAYIALYYMFETRTYISNVQTKVKGNKRFEICFLYFQKHMLKKVWHSIKEHFENWNIGGKMLKNCFIYCPIHIPLELIYILRKLSICHKTLKEGNCFLLSGNEQRSTHWNVLGELNFNFLLLLK